MREHKRRRPQRAYVAHSKHDMLCLWESLTKVFYRMYHSYCDDFGQEKKLLWYKSK